MREEVFTNANIVLAGEVIHGTIQIRDGQIADLASGCSMLPGAMDLEGDFLLPGFVELHTDNMEKHMTPRPKTEWPSVSAAVAHDGQLAISGITTVLDAVALGDVKEGSSRITRLKEMIGGMRNAREAGLLRVEHFLHLRCEVSYPDLPAALDGLATEPGVKMFSVMDHTPGQRQFVSMDAYYTYYQGKFGLTDREMDAFIAARKREQQEYSHRYRQMVVELARSYDITLASHDDATLAHVEEAVEDGMSVAEFPTTLEAAAASHAAGLKVMMGGPNIVRGRSHSGNVSARDLAAEKVLDVISSDYVPHSLLQAAMILHDDFDHIALPDAIRLISKNPAESIGLDDRGEILPGKRADLVHMHHSPHHPVIRGVWSGGHRVA
ncbi:alpha-D-ribose 1-methylphosphonate 5-triphosphate diphosphatase [Aestuariispira insulae]|uniref:Alpha-D-ribose 1-methylphosphonate 5-triphosphate diphosphatase n=1 Tax=Aestuariispira insulae TaxID=1461337 RepID=A0A3D9H5U8_9PROT|nr:alpha-D-ribose 1-methylphosphonate 5-triphosphate diphosphatase [Aestuariispira insulae]RED44870.1 alpha-D-ribose 1-methylphosphonate 5-triphosphate diphosphatase [Aestuariispira insulae]